MERKQIIDLTRTLSIFLVMGYHLLFWGRFARPNGVLDIGFIFCNGWFGVPLFFMISGYLITGSIANGKYQNYAVHIRDFYTRRIARILPLLCLVILWAFLLLNFFHGPSALSRPVFWNGAARYDFWFWISLPLFFLNWVICLSPAGDFGLQWGILWSLAVEEQFYALYPWVLKFTGKNNRIFIFLGLVILCGPLYRAIVSFSSLDPNFKLELITFGSFAAFDQIAMGALLYFVSIRWKSKFKRKGLCAVLCAAGFLLMVSDYWGFGIGGVATRYGAIGRPFFLALGCFFFLLGGIRLNFFEWKGFEWIALPGKLSYGCYLLHPTVLFFLGPWIPRLQFYQAFLFLAVLTTFAAYWSYAFFEQPANRWVRKTFASRDFKTVSPSMARPK